MNDPPPPYLETDSAGEAAAVRPGTSGVGPDLPSYTASPAQSRDEIVRLRASSTEYFQSHPSPNSQDESETICHTMEAPLDTTQSIPYPDGQVWPTHGISEEDWYTFVNHLYPASSRPSGDKKTLVSEDPRKTKQRIFAITSHWNTGFFEPRGIMIIPEMVDTSSRPAPPTLPHPPSASPPEIISPAPPPTVTLIVPEERAELEARAATLIEAHKDGALSFCVERHDTKLVRILLDKGQSPNNKGGWGKEPPLQIAVSNNDTEIAEMLLESRDIKVDGKQFFGETAMYKAVTMNNVYLVRKLLAKGANPEKCITGNETMLYRAANRNYLDIAQALLEAGAKVDNSTMAKGTALYTSVTEGNIAMAELLLDHGASVDVYPMGHSFMVQQAAFKKNEQMLQLLVAHGADINKSYTTGYTSLDDLVMNGDIDAAVILLKNGADPNIVNMWGQTALDIAYSNSNKKMIAVLARYGADVERKSKGSDETMIYKVAMNRETAILRVMLEHGAGGDREALTSRLRARALTQGNKQVLEAITASERPSMLASISWLWGQ